MDITENSMWMLQHKLNKLNKKLAQWSKESLGNVFEQVNS